MSLACFFFIDTTFKKVGQPKARRKSREEDFLWQTLWALEAF